MGGGGSKDDVSKYTNCRVRGQGGKITPIASHAQIRALVVAFDYKNPSCLSHAGCCELTSTIDANNFAAACSSCVDENGKPRIQVSKYLDTGGIFPRKDTIMDQFSNAAKSLGPDDVFIFFYAGHGCQVKDEDGDEDDGMDEALCFVKEDGTRDWLVDDELAQLLAQFNPQTRILAVTDCCHSGTATDLQRRELNGRPIVHLAAVSDKQCAVDMGTGGAFTSAVLETLERVSQMDVAELSAVQIFNAVYGKFEIEVQGDDQTFSFLYPSGFDPDTFQWPIVPKRGYSVNTAFDKSFFQALAHKLGFDPKQERSVQNIPSLGQASHPPQISHFGKSTNIVEAPTAMPVQYATHQTPHMQTLVASTLAHRRTGADTCSNTCATCSQTTSTNATPLLASPAHAQRRLLSPGACSDVSAVRSQMTSANSTSSLVASPVCAQQRLPSPGPERRQVALTNSTCSLTASLARAQQRLPSPIVRPLLQSPGKPPLPVPRLEVGQVRSTSRPQRVMVQRPRSPSPVASRGGSPAPRIVLADRARTCPPRSGALTPVPYATSPMSSSRSIMATSRAPSPPASNRSLSPSVLARSLPAPMTPLVPLVTGSVTPPAPALSASSRVAATPRQYVGLPARPTSAPPPARLNNKGVIPLRAYTPSPRSGRASPHHAFASVPSRLVLQKARESPTPQVPASALSVKLGPMEATPRVVAVPTPCRVLPPKPVGPPPREPTYGTASHVTSVKVMNAPASQLRTPTPQRLFSTSRTCLPLPPVPSIPPPGCDSASARTLSSASCKNLCGAYQQMAQSGAYIPVSAVVASPTFGTITR